MRSLSANYANYANGQIARISPLVGLPTARVQDLDLESNAGPLSLLSVEEICRWARAEGFGGLMSFELSNEYLPGQTGDARNPLSAALWSPPAAANHSVSHQSEENGGARLALLRGYSMRSSSWFVNWPASGPVSWTIRTV